MTGFRLNWRLENTPVLEAKIDTLGKMVETPRFGGTVDPEFFTSDHVFKMRVQFPGNLLEQLGNGSLVMQLEVNTREAEAWDEEVHYWMGDSKFSSDEDLYKSWADADDYCKAEGGHLASMKTDADTIEINRIIEQIGWNVWVGGRESSGQNWTWTDGSLIIEPKWYGFVGAAPYCTMLYGGHWWKNNCRDPYPFVCQNDVILRGNQTLKWKYNRTELSFSSLNVWYQYKAQNSTVLGPFEEISMTGFRFRWFMEDENGRKSTHESEADEIDWRPMTVWPKFAEKDLKVTVAMAQKSRRGGQTNNDFVTDALKQKKRMSKDDVFNGGRCTYNQMDGLSKDNIFKELGDSQPFNDSIVTSDDIEDGLVLYSLLMFCPQEMLVEKFLQNLVFTENLPTLLQATVNTIMSKYLAPQVKKVAGDFFLKLRQKFNLKFGEVLIASSSLAQMRTMMNLEMPFLAPYKGAIAKCLDGNDCGNIKDLIGSLGK